MQISLPIDAYIPEIHRKLNQNNVLILIAPPGTGKTTRVPASFLPSLLKNQNNTNSQIIVLEPRRLAARLSAERVAAELNLKVGEEVGYRFRGENKESKITKLSFYTEGTFIRRMVQDPRLKDVNLVIIDEFHERHLSGDCALSMIRYLKSTSRPDLNLILMSATLEINSLKKFLPEAQIVEIKIPFYELKTAYHPESISPTKAIQLALNETQNGGNILVFLPGKSEIIFWKNALQNDPSISSSIHTLHGEMNKNEQQKTLDSSSVNKIILSTNIAESSLTIPGVRTVIDTGFTRRADESPNGLKILRTVKTSQSSAIQRAGRAARLGPGFCLRLYTKNDFDSRPFSDKPEILRADLTRIILDLFGMQIKLSDWKWFEPPLPSQTASAVSTLGLLGSIDINSNQLTLLGQWMYILPFHPRNLRILFEAFRYRETYPKAYDQIYNQIAEWEQREPEERWFQNQIFLKALNASSDLKRFNNSNECESWCYLCGFSDRIQSDPVQPSTHGRIIIDDIQFQGEAGKNSKKTKLGQHQIFPVDWLLDLTPSPVTETKGWTYDPDSKKIRYLETIQAGSWVIEKKEIPIPTADGIITLNENPFQILLRDGLNVRTIPASWNELIEKLNPFTDTSTIETMAVKVAIFNEHYKKEIQKKDNPLFYEFFCSTAASILSLRQLKEANWIQLFSETIPANDSNTFYQFFPDFLTLPSGRIVKIHYSLKEAPFIESRIQDFFGLKTTPTIVAGKIKLTVKLLAPNGRPQQVTQDLEGFWTRSYPEIRKELRSRYPKHAWPEKP